MTLWEKHNAVIVVGLFKFVQKVKLGLIWPLVLEQLLNVIYNYLLWWNSVLCPCWTWVYFEAGIKECKCELCWCSNDHVLRCVEYKWRSMYRKCMVFIVQYFQCVASGDRWPRAGHDKGPLFRTKPWHPLSVSASFLEKSFLSSLPLVVGTTQGICTAK